MFVPQGLSGVGHRTEATARAFAGDVTGALEVARRAAPGGAGPARETLEHVLVASGRWAEAEAMLRAAELRLLETRQALAALGLRAGDRAAARSGKTSIL